MQTDRISKVSLYKQRKTTVRTRKGKEKNVLIPFKE